MPPSAFRSFTTRSDYDGQLVAEASQAAFQARFAVPAKGLSPILTAALQAKGLSRLYTHQAQALDAIRAGGHVTLVTPTASGKTLSGLLPVLETLIQEPTGHALYLYPIKALAQDQHGILNEWLKSVGEAGGPPGLKAAIYDGDTAPSARSRIKRQPPAMLLSNPDMLHLGLLPYHSGWGSFFSRLRYVIVDEAHSYRGVFGAHVGMVLRRLRRMARFYGSDPQFILQSATIANPAGFAEKLIGAPATVIDDNGAPQGSRHVGLWNPLASPYREATDLFGQLVGGGHKTIAFTKARKITELMSMWTAQDHPDWKDRVASYRAGYLPEQRRAIEQKLFQGGLDGVIATSALELGIDVGGLDACVLVGFPGTMISTRQRMGRVGRGGQDSLVLMVGLNDALDQYFMRHPETFFGRATENALIPIDNPVILAGHVLSAAAELPLEPTDEAYFGPAYPVLVQSLWRQGRLRQGVEGKYHPAQLRPSREVNLRSSGETFFIQSGEGKGAFMLGTLELPRVYRDGHPGAIYLHQGAQWEVQSLDLKAKRVQVREVSVDHYTEARGEDNIEIQQVFKRRELGGVQWCFGQVRAREQVTGYVTKHVSTQKVLSEHELELPLHEYETQAAWWQLPSAWRKEFAEMNLDFAGSIHALEHAQIALLPVFALCDRWDLGGVSYWSQPQLDQPAIFIYDGHAGGAALAEQGFEIVKPWLEAVRELLDSCPCEDGCPACIQSPKCGNGNKPLDKQGAKELCGRLLRRLEGAGGTGVESGAGSAVGGPPVPATPVGLGAAGTLPPGGGRENVPGSSPPSASFLPPSGGRVPAGPFLRGPQGEGGPRPKPDPETHDIVTWDLETQFLADEVGGWDNKAAMKISVAVLYSSKAKEFRHYTEGQIPQMIVRLKQADLVVGFNNKNFDNAVLAAYPGGEAVAGLPTLDLLEEVSRSLGRRLKLDSLAQTTLGKPKTADGLMAVQWWREGRLKELLDYCQADVAITRDLWEFGRKYGYLLYEEKRGLMRLPVDW
jgi:DEAD/DEAH box helicase domain-containing protein